MTWIKATCWDFGRRRRWVGAAGEGASPLPCVVFEVTQLGLSADHHPWVPRRLLQLEQLSEQDGFVSAGANARQPEGLAKEPAVCTTALAEPTVAACRALVEGMGDYRPSALKVLAKLADVDACHWLMAEAK